MVDLNQYRVTWTGLPGFPGVSTFYSTGAPGPLQGKLKQFATALQICIPSGCTLTVPAAGQVIDSATGQAKAAWAVGTEQVSPGNGSPSYAAPVGVYIKWQTAIYNLGRALTGKTFVVPISSDQFSADGTPGANIISLVNQAAATLVGGTDPMVIYSRKYRSTGVALSGITKDKAVVLTSRRD